SARRDASSARVAAALARFTASVNLLLGSQPVPSAPTSSNAPMPASAFFMRITSLLNVCGSGAHYLRRLPRLDAASQRAAADSTRLAAASARRDASSARVAAAFACSTSFLPTQPTAIVPTSASAAKLAPNLRAFIPTHLLCPEGSRGGLGKATPFVSQMGCARNQASDGSGK